MPATTDFRSSNGRWVFVVDVVESVAGIAVVWVLDAEVVLAKLKKLTFICIVNCLSGIYWNPNSKLI